MRLERQRPMLSLVCCALAMQFSPVGMAAEIYRCTVDGKVVLTDHATGHCEPLVMQPANLAQASKPKIPSETATHSKDKVVPLSRKQHESESIAARQIAARQRCLRIDDQLKDIQVKMRSGYSLQQGEKLRERERSLRRKWRTEGCR